MNSQIDELSANKLLVKVSRRTKAREVLASSRMQQLRVWIVMAGIAVPNVVLNNFDAPLPVRILISVSFLFALFSQLEAWDLRRRLDAAIALLEQNDDEHH